MGFVVECIFGAELLKLPCLKNSVSLESSILDLIVRAIQCGRDKAVPWSYPS